ncbi:hypothetical protein F4827_004063 [Paraburkholderia bannensis]|uniref:O-antigen ligase domain-containing protein n=1 Tax=Paraburkholderia bannensis TaxID=765414 RepID=A0A7W9WU24_9BURK|nr:MULTISPECIES: hypothetical protein [Paraburkholderia]MBB3259189.1 hypothetical protein [Paraburkholderia sp. WP4_3_2]MBB6104204.1 hypothetical protein [Paraburkholderia bannensis]
METASSKAALSPVFSAEPARARVMLWLLALLPLFGQTFHYISALAPLWALSKAFPVLSLPAAFRLAGYPRFPVTRQILISFAWLVLFPSFAAMFYFHEGFFTSITAQVKLLPLLYFFSFLALLLTLEPTLHELERSFIVAGVIVICALIVMAAIVPDSWYSGSYVVGQASFFTNDSRGHRIRMSMYFPIILLFFCYRRTFFERHLGYFFGVAVAFAVTLLIVKTRAMIIGIMGVLLINAFVWARPMARLGLLVCAPFALVGVFSAGYLATTFNLSSENGFDTRRISIQLASGFLGSDPLRWLFGVGTISPTSSDSLIDYFHHFFFLADITWLGIVFEYGVIGAAILLLFQLRGLLLYRRLRAKVEDDFLGALFDYLIYILVISFFYPPTLTPGETAVILAVFVYVWHAGNLNEDGDQAIPVHDADSRSDHAAHATP